MQVVGAVLELVMHRRLLSAHLEGIVACDVEVDGLVLDVRHRRDWDVEVRAEQGAGDQHVVLPDLIDDAETLPVIAPTAQPARKSVIRMLALRILVDSYERSQRVAG